MIFLYARVIGAGKSYSALVEAGMDPVTMPFELYFLRYKVHGATAWMTIVTVLDTLMADGKDDEYLIPLIKTRLQSFFDDHGSPVANWRKSNAMRRELLASASAAAGSAAGGGKESKQL